MTLPFRVALRTRFDLADHETGPFNKFISYYLFPEARYSVGVTLASRAKISIAF